VTGISVAEVQVEALALLGDTPEGDGLDDLSLALIRLATFASPTTLDLAATSDAVDAALDAGATPEQLQELLVLISGVGMHTLIGTSTVLADALRRHGDASLAGELDGETAEVADALIGQGGREARIAGVAPDFWPNLLRLSSLETVRAIADYRAAPWAGQGLTPLQRELVGIAVDSMPTHRFLPTLLVHVRQAVVVGAGRRAIQQVLEVASTTPLHPGVR
jgi:alkylhydroperoxidase/carboxymuconolactone decarboxylase family protein YurZ